MKGHAMRKSLVPVVIGLLLAFALVPAAPASAAPYCGITWGSGDKAAGPATSPAVRITNVRTGRDTCWDRLVFDLSGPAAGYTVKYVPEVYADPSGVLIPLNGGAKLEVVVRAATAGSYPGVVGRPLPGVDLTGYRTFRDAKFAGNFEGITTVGLGVRARLPFRVFKLGNRVVLDVAHLW
jgi:hypothetical protein